MSNEIAPENYGRGTDGTDECIEDEPSIIPAIPPVWPFVQWIDPPIGFDMNGYDPNHPYYRVRIMSVGAGVVVPLVDFIVGPPPAAIPPIWEFQMIGVNGGGCPPPEDPAGLLYYKTMTVRQGAPGLKTVRSRIFTPPHSNPSVQNHINAVYLEEVAPALFQVAGIPNHPNVWYKHVKITNNNVGGGSPLDLYLQQPL